MKMLINGSWCDAKSGEVIEILNPSNSEIIDTVPRGRVEDVEEAVQAALKGYEINRGAKESEQYVSKYGRARSYKEKTIGTPDAGAVSTSLFFAGLCDGLK